MNNIEDMNKEDLLFFLDCYNNYIIDFFDEHDNSLVPVCIYEFFDNEFQHILEEQQKEENEV